MNKVLIVGRLTRDPETKVSSNDIKFSRFTIAVSRTFGDKQADFIPVVAWRAQADFLDKYVKKGRLVSVEGRFTSSNYEKDGQRITRYEITADRVQALDSGNRTSNSSTTQNKFSSSEQNETSSTKVLEFEGEKKDNENEANNTDIPWDLDL